MPVTSFSILLPLRGPSAAAVLMAATATVHAITGRGLMMSVLNARGGQTQTCQRSGWSAAAAAEQNAAALGSRRAGVCPRSGSAWCLSRGTIHGFSHPTRAAPRSASAGQRKWSLLSAPLQPWPSTTNSCMPPHASCTTYTRPAIVPRRLISGHALHPGGQAAWKWMDG